MAEDAHPEALVDTSWLADHLSDPKVRIIESNEDILLYDTGHIPGAVKVDWQADLNDQVERDYLNKEGFEKLASRLGSSNETKGVFYGDKNNWCATYALWVFKLFGHKDARILNGGRKKWIDEGREVTKTVPSYPAAQYTAEERDDATIRAFRDQVREHIKQSDTGLVDVRSPQEYSGEKTHMPEYPQEGTLRGGHIPTAKSIPWAKAANEDGTFKSPEDL